MSQSNQNVACHFVGQVREKVFRFSIDLKKKGKGHYVFRKI